MSADVSRYHQMSVNCPFTKSKQPDHLKGWFWRQTDHLITYWELNCNLRNVSCQLMSAAVIKC